MKNIIGAVFSVAAAFVLAGDALAASSVYTNEAAFKAASGAGVFSLNEFGDITSPGQTPALTYKTSAADPRYRVATGGFGANPPYDVFSIMNSEGTRCVGVSVMPYGDQSLQIDMLGGEARAVGGNFFNTDQNGDFQDAWLAFKLSDGTVTNFNFQAVSTNAFFGFVSGGPSTYITQIKVFNQDISSSGLYPTVSRLYVVGSVPVPEPSVVITNLAVLLGAGMGAVYYRRRNAKRG